MIYLTRYPLGNVVECAIDLVIVNLIGDPELFRDFINVVDCITERRLEKIVVRSNLPASNTKLLGGYFEQYANRRFGNVRIGIELVVEFVNREFGVFAPFATAFSCRRNLHAT